MVPETRLGMLFNRFDSPIKAGAFPHTPLEMLHLAVNGMLY
jgi:hypothetical protein